MSSPVPVAIASGGFTWTSALVALLNVLVGGALVAIIRTRPQMRQIKANEEANLLQERAAEMASMRDRIDKLESDLDKERASRAAEVSILRHENAQLSQIITMFVALIETSPDKAREHARMVREEMEKGAARIAAEKAAIRGAQIIAAGKPAKDAA